MMINIAEGKTIIFNFPLSIFNSAAERLPDKLKSDRFLFPILPHPLQKTNKKISPVFRAFSFSTEGIF